MLTYVLHCCPEGSEWKKKKRRQEAEGNNLLFISSPLKGALSKVTMKKSNVHTTQIVMRSIKNSAAFRRHSGDIIE